MGGAEAGWFSAAAVEAAVVALENHPSFNAGPGAVLNAAGEHDLDAAIMDGRGRRAGAIASASHIRAARMRYRGDDLAIAAAAAITDLPSDGAGDGLIAVDAHGQIAMLHNTEGMYRGAVTADGLLNVGICR